MPTDQEQAALKAVSKWMEKHKPCQPYGGREWMRLQSALASLLTCYAAEAVAAARPEIERPWRRLEAFGHACLSPGTIYGDNDELQCAGCMIDFRRDTVEQIEARLSALMGERMELRAQRKEEFERQARIKALEEARNKMCGLCAADMLPRHLYYDVWLHELEPVLNHEATSVNCKAGPIWSILREEFEITRLKAQGGSNVAIKRLEGEGNG